MGGNKARKLEPLCGAALTAGADTLVTVGAAQSNHCRMTAAAGARLGLRVHLVLGGEAPASATGNQLLASLFGAELHFAGTDDWSELEAAKDARCASLAEAGSRPYPIPIGGSTPLGALGFAWAWRELMDQCADVGCRPRAVIHATSSGGTHAGLLAGRALYVHAELTVPEILAVAVAKGILADAAFTAGLADQVLDLLGADEVRVDPAEVELDGTWLGPDYAVGTPDADAALVWAAHRGGWVLDRVYTAKAFAGLLSLASTGRWASGDDVVFWHTGGQPALFAPGGYPSST
jgi:1-aminocyclopropane-1-carboxylate deaminase/D-cysteine desulfhydrase-like pyridoxal-dependent ACC family enzyme